MIQPSVSCVPSCFKYEIDKEFTVTNTKTNHIYNSLDKVKHTPCQIRGCFTILGLFQSAVILLARIPARCICLLTGDFVSPGFKNGHEEWLIARQAWSLEFAKNGKATSALPEMSSRYLKIAKHILTQLAKNIIKIVTLPLALIALEFAALYGAIVHPVDGMMLYSGIEHIWSRDGIRISSHNWHDLYRVTDYLAICMQPIERWMTRDFYTIFDDHAKYELSNLKTALFNKVLACKTFLSKEGINVNCALDTLEVFEPTEKFVKSKYGKTVAYHDKIGEDLKKHEIDKGKLERIEFWIDALYKTRDLVIRCQSNKGDNLADLHKQQQDNVKALLKYFQNDDDKLSA